MQERTRAATEVTAPALSTMVKGRTTTMGEFDMDDDMMVLTAATAQMAVKIAALEHLNLILWGALARALPADHPLVVKMPDIAAAVREGKPTPDGVVAINDIADSLLRSDTGNPIVDSQLAEYLEEIAEMFRR